MLDYSQLLKTADEIGCTYTLDEPMSNHTTFHIGGPADVFITPGNKQALAQIFALCNQLGLPTTVIGNGSNMLVSDKGIRGVVISTVGALSDIELVGACDIVCGAGVKLSRLCSFALEHSLGGMEFAWGIPGTAGGAAYMNAGAYDGEISQVITECEHIMPDGEIVTLPVDEMGLGYRTSVYSGNGCLITAVRVRLHPDLQELIREKMDDLMNRRRSKQPLELPSAGSVFKRPQGNFAGTMIEQCGLKGYTVGGAQVSEKHAGFIVNIGDATCFDVQRLIEHIQSEVYMRFSVKLECEIKIIGEK
ncbi:MAG: UDP-N-acetylmuramate dehydrogenase [Firmicutes bacterium]|nr:UDP-N-acetylmuramate dehydrogenase [Bacillota bacterium]